jgi:penicillin amidase
MEETMSGTKIYAWTRRLAIVFGVALAVAALSGWLFLRASLAQLDGTRAAPGLSATVSVTRDARGVPTISGASRLDVAYATGFVQAQERYFQMDLLRRIAAGELAELFGARALAGDRAHRLHRFRARATQALLAMPRPRRALLERYVAGVNDGLAALTARPFEYALLGLPPRTWSAEDSLLVIWAMYLDLQGGLEARELSRGWLKAHSSDAQLAFLLPEASKWDAFLDAPGVTMVDAALPPRAPAWWAAPAAPANARLAGAEWLDSVGSNNWAVAGSRTGSGAAIVSDDMHLGISLPNTWYRAVLRFPGSDGVTRRMVGLMLPGAPPVIVVGSNGHVAWGFTNSYGDYLDLVAVARDAGHPGQVRLPGGWETPLTHQETILVKAAPAELLTVRDTSLGPLRQADGGSYALHWTAHAAEAVNFETQDMENAMTVGDALAIAARMGIPAQNMVTGDTAGNIGWTIAGPLPRRTQAGFALTFPLQADDQAPTWSGWLQPAEYPKVVNPAGGQLQTANSRQLAGPAAGLLGDGGFDLGARTRQIRDDLAALEPKADVQAVYAVSLDDRAWFMAGWRERAMAVLDQRALAGHPERAQFLQSLKGSWNGRASVDSSGYRLSRAFMYALYDALFDGANRALAAIDPKASVASATSRWPVVVARLLDEQPAAWLPPQYTSWRAVELAAVDRVIDDLLKDGETPANAVWGLRNTAAIAHPISNAEPILQRWLAAPADMLPGDSNMPRVAGRRFGQSERLTVSPGREEEGVFNMPGGQSGHPLSPFFLAGHEDWVAGRPTPLLPGAPVHTLTFTKQAGP